MNNSECVRCHIASDVPLAGGQTLVPALLFAVEAGGGLNCTKVPLEFEFTLNIGSSCLV